MSTRFTIGQIVRLIADHTRSGPIIAEIPMPGGQMRYRVFHSPIDIREYMVDQIEAVDIFPTGNRKIY
ncbi:MAG: hypothetical protein Q7U53_17445 [Anaerolineaceae bacterium]|nr:hypothetical protein [Anaerolineaceae bacterium]